MSLITASSVNFDLIAPFRVIGYFIYDDQEKDVAEIRDLLVDADTKRPRYAIIEVGGFLSILGKKILIPWAALKKGGLSRMNIQLSQERIICAPTLKDPIRPTRTEEESIHHHFNVDPYWFDEPEDGEDEKLPGAKSEPPAQGSKDTQEQSPITGLTLEKNE